MAERVAVKITGRTTGRIVWLDAEAARRVVAEGRGEYLALPGELETAAIEPPENAALRTGRAPARRPGKPG